MSRFSYPVAGVATSILMAGWAMSRYNMRIAVVLVALSLLLTILYLVSRQLSRTNIGLSGGYIGSLLGCLLLPLLDLFRPFYASAGWFGPIFIGFALLMWPAVICIAGATGIGIGYFFSKSRNKT
jgi:hypothetical protein